MAIRPAISSLSLGLPSIHPLAGRLDQASRHGFDVELFHDDIVEIASQIGANSTAAEAQIQAATIIRGLCDDRGIRIVCLQPFRHYEGLKDRRKHKAKIEEMKVWIELVKVLGTDLIGIPSSFLDDAETSGDIDLIVADLRELADLGLPHGVRFAYEALAWGTHVDTWEKAWEIVLQVNRVNFGLCLDTFNMAGRVYADPTVVSGIRSDGGAAIAESLQCLREVIVLDKVFWVQVVDAERLSKPLDSKHLYYVPNQPPRMSWSRNCRLFYGEQHLGGYLPISAILRTVLIDLGFEGCLSAELFNKSISDPGPHVPEEHGRRAAISWQKLKDELGLTEYGKQERGNRP